MKVLTEYAVSECVIKGSRFISEIFPVTTQNEAREMLKAQKTKYTDATHVVHAFTVGDTAGIMGMSDDGEPSGTAGRPVLDVLKGSGITNILLTVTRYFGGTLLGTGGLVHAYSGGAKDVLAVAKTEELVKKVNFVCVITYDKYDIIKRVSQEFHISNCIEDFQTDITINGTIYEAKKKLFADRVFDITQGKSEVIFE